MKAFKRTLALLICIVMVASLFVACGKDSSQGTGTKDPGTSSEDSPSTSDKMSRQKR